MVLKGLTRLQSRETENSVQNIINVLHIDDDDAQCLFLRTFLEGDSQFRVTSIQNPEDAKYLIQTGAYECLITDYDMPEKDGITLAKEIRKQSKIPIIIYTGRGSEEVAERAFEAGVDDYIRKEDAPAHYQILGRRIRQAVERERSLSRLAESEKKYRSLVENSLQGIAIIKGPKPRFVFANSTLGKIFGVSPEEILTLSPEEILQGIFREDRDSFFRRFRERLKGKDVASNYIFRGYRKDSNSVIWLEVNAKIIDYEGEPAVQAIFQDITDKKTTEAALEESENKFRTIFENARDIITYVDTHGNIMDVNERIEEVLGYKKDEVIGKNFANLGLIGFSEIPRLIKLFASGIRNRKAIGLVNVGLKHRDGRRLLFEVGTRFINNKSGKTVGVVNIFRDITDREKKKK